MRYFSSSNQNNILRRKFFQLAMSYKHIKTSKQAQLRIDNTPRITLYENQYITEIEDR